MILQKYGRGWDSKIREYVLVLDESKKNKQTIWWIWYDLKKKKKKKLNCDIAWTIQNSFLYLPD